MKILIFLFLTILPSLCIAQKFNLAGRKQIKVPTSVSLQLYKYIEANDGISLVNDQFAFVPVYNALSSSEKQFSDGIYFFTWGSHDSGRLFINKKGKISIFGNSSVLEILTDYNAFIKTNKLTESTQIAYLNIISSFMKYRYDDQKMLLQSGVIIKTK
jgi:hypothetical protein